MEEIASFGDWVRQRRRVLGWTQAALAEQVGCAVVTIKKIEQEERRPSEQLAELLADRLAIPRLLRDDFIKMGRGIYVSSVNIHDEGLLPPLFLQNKVPSTEKLQLPFVTRRRELARLEDYLAAALSGDGKVIFIVGEAGRGKTRLMTEFSRRALDAYPELVSAVGHCNKQAGKGAPYLPFLGILNMLTGDLESSWVTGNISQELVLRLWSLLPYTIRAITEYGPDIVNTLVLGRPLVRRLIPYIGKHSSWIDDFQALTTKNNNQLRRIDQKYLLDQVTRVLCSLARRRPLLLLLDDLQWVDEASKNLLFHLGRQLTGSRILVVGAYRSSEIAIGQLNSSTGQVEEHPLEQVINEFKRRFGDIQIDLGGYDPSEAWDFTNALIDSEPNQLGEEFRENLFTHTKGHPLFTVEILRDLQENGNLIRNEAGEWIESTAPMNYRLPARVDAVISQRINRLAEPLQEVLKLASVEGELFTAQVIAQILDMDEKQILQCLNQDLEQRHYLVQEHGVVNIGGRQLNRFKFGHVLFKEYLYRRLGRGEKRILHHKVGSTLERVLFLNQIFTVGLPANPTFEETEAFLIEQADRDNLDMFISSLAHHYWHGQEWIKAAFYSMQAGRLALRAFALHEAIINFDRAMQSLENIPDPPEDWVYKAIIFWVEAAYKIRPYSEQLQRLSEAEKIARKTKNNRRLIETLSWTSDIYLARGLWTQAGPALMECFEIANALGYERLTVRPSYFKALMATFADPHHSLQLLDRSLELAQQYHDPVVKTLSLGTQGQVLAQLGKFNEAKATMKSAHDALQQVESPLTESDVDLLAAWTYMAMGNWQLGLELGHRSVEKAIAADNLECICSGLNCIGYCHMELNQVAEASANFKEAVNRSEKIGAFTHLCLGKAGLAATRFATGNITATSELETALGEMQSYDNQVGAANIAQMLAICLIQKNDLGIAEEYLQMACNFYRQSEMNPYLVRSLSTLVELFAIQKRTTEVQAVLSEIAMTKKKIG